MLPLLLSVLIYQGTETGDFVEIKYPENKRYVYVKKTTVYFDLNSYKLGNREEKKLRVFGKGDEVIVSGFASPEGSRKYNHILSRKRAESVADILKKRGIVVKSIRAEGEDHCWVPKSKFYRECRKVEVEESHGPEGFDLP